MKYTVKMLFEHFKNSKDEITNISLQGWIKTNRINGNIAFIEFNDGSYFLNAQVVYSKDLNNFDEVCKFTTYTAISVKGRAIKVEGGLQPFDIIPDSIKLEGAVDEDYPLQKKRHSFEFMRQIAHLRPRANTFNAVFRVRSELSLIIHNYFHENGFLYLHSPIITSNDAEGAGESFIVTTRTDDKYEQDFFGRKSALTVTGQLNAEAYALAFGKVYTFGPIFRAEKSNTPRHANEFWMIEPEIAYCDLKQDMEIIEDVVKYAIKEIMKRCPEELKFFNKMFDNTLIERLTAVSNSTFKKISYTDAVEELKRAKQKGHQFQFDNIIWGMDLQSEHEKYLCEVIANGPLFITDYPKEIKAFYMKNNDDGKTVAAADLLVPKIGELVGASQREERLDVLKKRMEEMNNIKELEWYLDLRRYGGVYHSGFGIGFERLLMYVTGIENIKDVIPFPRTPGHIDF